MRRASPCLLLLVLSPFAGAQTTDDGIYSLEQAASGRDIYVRNCTMCHGAALEGAEGGTDLVGRAFRMRWLGLPLSEFFDLTKQTMPVTNPAGLSDVDYADVVAFMLNRNGYTPGKDVLSSDMERLAAIEFVEPVTTVATNPGKAEVREGITTEWLHHRGDAGSMNYSALDLINRDNIDRLEVSWRWKSDNFGSVPWANLQTTPILANGVLYVTAGQRRVVVAIDGESGETLWMYRIHEGERGDHAPRKGPGRGVAFYRGVDRETIFLISPGYHLIAIDAATGRPQQSFGDNGIVDLKLQIGQDVDPVTARIGSSSPPMVVNDVVIVGSAFPAGGAPPTKEMPVGNVTAYDARTGERLWIFHTIPRPGEYGHNTWLDDAWTFTGNVGVWAPMSADPDLGLVYLPVEAPTGDFYGGHRPGENLYAQSIVSLNAQTGERVWHFQTVHHPIWDYDLPASPLLIDIEVDGKTIPAVAQITKQGFTFVFDRRTGEPVWPIEERPVAPSTIPGEIAHPTQPFPTMPEYFQPNGVLESDLNDLTPEILAEAKRIASAYTLGPVYTPPTVITDTKKGTLVMPGTVGGANWQGAVADPESGILYVSSTSSPVVYGMVRDPDRSNMRYVADRGALEGPYGLPLLKPPWGRITAIDLNTGKIRWVIANGDTPEEIASHEKLQGVDMPRTGHDDRAGLLVTRSLLFAGEGIGLYGAKYGGSKFRAHDKLTGEILAEVDMGVRQSGVPMTYAINGRQYIVVAAGAANRAGELVALTLSDE